MLIDEIENAGINRRMALKLLTGRDKIVFIATHDPGREKTYGLLKKCGQQDLNLHPRRTRT